MIFEYEVGDDSYTVDLIEEQDVGDTLFHVTSKSDRTNIEKEGLKVRMPTRFSIATYKALFLTIPIKFHTDDLFKWDDEYYCIIVIDVKKIPGIKFYKDFLCMENADIIARGQRHVMCLENIPPEAIKQVIQF